MQPPGLLRRPSDHIQKEFLAHAGGFPSCLGGVLRHGEVTCSHLASRTLPGPTGSCWCELEVPFGQVQGVYTVYASCLPLFPIQILEKGSPYPIIILPQFGGYWIEDPENLGTPTSSDSSICEEEEEHLSPSSYCYKLECKGEARAYRKHFLGKVSGR